MTHLYAYVPFSRSFADDQVVLHANLGWLRDRVLEDNRTTWGLAAGVSLSDRLTVFGEVFGDDRTDPFVQTGLIRGFMDDFIHLDLSVGRQLGSAPDTSFVAIGLNVYFPPFRNVGRSSVSHFTRGP